MGEILLRQIKKVYGANTAILKGIDLTIHEGEFLVLVGPSGCGKSTLLRCIAGLEDISDGELVMNGKLANQVPPKERDVAMVFQSYALYPHMTVRENMGFSLSIRKRPKEEIARAVDEAAALLELTPYLARFPRELSGGQRQRVAIGRSIVRRPSVFLFDEPLSNLDANLRAQMRVELKKLHQRLGTTMIYVTHDQIEAMTLADRICVLEGGYARQVDSPTALYERPNSRFVAEFIGSPPMNFLTLNCADRKLSGVGVSIPLAAHYPASLPAYMLAGIRPHELTRDLSLPGQIEATVEVVETVGWDLHVHARIGETPVIAQIEAKGATFKPGERIRFGVNPEHVLLFDLDTTRALPQES